MKRGPIPVLSPMLSIVWLCRNHSAARLQAVTVYAFDRAHGQRHCQFPEVLRIDRDLPGLVRLQIPS